MADSGRSREIRNAATGETVRIIRAADETGGELLVMEARWTDPNHATPAHIHPAMEERWRVLEGEVGFRIAGRWEEFIRQLFALASEGLEGEDAQRSITELLTEFKTEIEIPASE